MPTGTTESAEIGNGSYLIANDLRIAYDRFGNPADPAIVLIMGLGTQMIAWPEAFCQGLANQGFQVIRFDNRDIGLSEKVPANRRVSIPRIMFRRRLKLPVKTPYTLHDMARDTIGVLDALQIDQAHLVGASMGGMIAQIVAATFPDRCHTLTSIMSTSGNPRLPTVSWKVTKLLLGRPTRRGEAGLLEHSMRIWRTIGSPDYPPSDDELRGRILQSIRRSYYPRGYLNQLAAIIENGDRRKLLGKITLPTLVIHGTADVLVPPAGGIDTAKSIDGSRLELIEGMGHDLPTELVPRLVEMIAGFIRTA